MNNDSSPPRNDDTEQLHSVDDIPTEDVFGKKPGRSMHRSLVGSVINGYTLRQVLGEGGMGVVYEAEQAHPIRRRVALKIIKPGMDSSVVIARFEAERQALAMMDHPNIARVIDGGATDRGLPFFVMELVKGVPITDFCDRHTLSLRKRIDLFNSVCSGVQHAHSKGVIHRDIKPSNILVEYEDSVPTPKIIDFGVAKAVDHRLSEHTIFTEQGQLIGTPEYMSPEQAEMSGLDIDTRADVYSLGVVLYELLAGLTPFDAQELRSAGLNGIRRLIREGEPPKPSTRLSTLRSKAETKVQASKIAMSRCLRDTELDTELRRDLDWIVLRCLEKDRERRYATPLALTEDLDRYLADEPVEAGPPSASYRIQKFMKRNRAGVLAGSAVVAVLMLGILTTTYFMLRARHQERLVIEEAFLARQAESLAEQAVIRAEKAHDDERAAREAAERERGRAQLSEARILGQSNEFGAAMARLQAIKDTVPKSEWWWTAWGCVRNKKNNPLRFASNSTSSDDRSRYRQKCCLLRGRWVCRYIPAQSDERGWGHPLGVYRFTNGSQSASLEFVNQRNRPRQIESNSEFRFFPPPEIDARHLDFRQYPGRNTFLTSPDWPDKTLRVYEGLGDFQIDGGSVWIDWDGSLMTIPAGYGHIAVYAFSGDDLTSWQPIRGFQRRVVATWSNREMGVVRVAYDDFSFAEFAIHGLYPSNDRWHGAADIRLQDQWLADPENTEQTPSGLQGALTTRRLVFSHDGDTLYAGSYSGSVTAFNTSSGDELWSRNYKSDERNADAYRFGELCLTPDERSLLVSTDGPGLSIVDSANGNVKRTITTTGILPRAAQAPDGTVYYSETDGVLAAIPHDATEPHPLLHEPGAFYYELAYDAPTGLLAAAVHRNATAEEPLSWFAAGEVIVFRPGNSHVPLWRRPLATAGRCVAFSPDHTLLATSERGGRVTVWNAETGDSIAVLEVFGARGHVQIVSGIAFHPTQPLIATASHDDTVRFWHAYNGSLLATIPLGGFATSDYLSGRLKDLAFHPDGKLLAIGFEERILWLDLTHYDNVLDQFWNQ